MNNEVNKHAITHKESGTGNMSSLTPVCSCGWTGSRHYAYNDTQLADIRREEARHLNAMLAHRAKGE